MKKYYTPRQASTILGVSVDTLRRWDKEGKINTRRTAGQTRQYAISSVIGEEQRQQTTVLYCRVSSPKQKADLERQITYMKERLWNEKIVDLSKAEEELNRHNREKASGSGNSIAAIYPSCQTMYAKSGIQAKCGYRIKNRFCGVL